MTRRSGLRIHDCLALLALLLLVACDEDPARSVKIASRPVPPGARRAAPPAGEQDDPHKRPGAAASTMADRRESLSASGLTPPNAMSGSRESPPAPDSTPPSAAGAAPRHAPAPVAGGVEAPGPPSVPGRQPPPAGAGAPLPPAGSDAPAPVGTGTPPPASPQVPEWQWRPELCPPPPEPAGGPGTLVASGACAFRQQGAVGCTTLPDDLILETSRPAARGATLIIYVNVEKYHGPGKYEDGQMLVSVQDAIGLYRWRSDSVRVTVGEDGRFADLETTRLESLPPQDDSEITVVGTLWCRPSPSQPPGDGVK